MMNRTTLSLAVALAALSGCVSMAPHYERPGAPVSATWPTAGDTQTGAAVSTASLGWESFVTEPRLKKLVQLGLDNNRDLRVAVLNIEKAQAQYGIQRAAQFPALNASASDTAQHYSEKLASSAAGTTSRQYSAGVGLSAYELDFFGRVRSLKDQALETYLATEEAQRSTRLSLIAEIANDWLTLAADHQHLKLARETYENQQKNLALTQRRFEVGTASALDVNQARTTVETARADLASYTSLVAQDANALTLAVGSPIPPELLPDDTPVTVATAQLPAGLPSEVLQRRPDVLQAERTLRAANANIGAARAAFFPRISLTASAGSASSSLDDLFKSGSGTWSFVPQISLPIFDAGTNSANLKVAEASRDIAVAQYEKAIQSAFREVADALAVRANLQERLDAQQSLVDAATQSFQLSQARYDKGVSSYIDVLDAQRTMYSAQQNLITLQQSQQANRVTLYKVLGGGTAADAK